MRLILLFLLFISTRSFSQYKDYFIGEKGDTLNIIDLKDQRQGKWVIRYEEVRGEPGYEEEGIFINNRKEGAWRLYNLTGDLIAIENYRWGNKDGISQYFNSAGELVREETWRAFNPDKEYDTLDVEDVDNPGNYKTVVVKNVGAGVKHGTWKYYNPTMGTIAKTENYVLGVLQSPKTADADAIINSEKKDKIKPKEVLEYEKQNSGKKKVKVRDGQTF